jgi:hypothetical protein
MAIVKNDLIDRINAETGLSRRSAYPSWIASLKS